MKVILCISTSHFCRTLGEGWEDRWKKEGEKRLSELIVMYLCLFVCFVFFETAKHSFLFSCGVFQPQMKQKKRVDIFIASK